MVKKMSCYKVRTGNSIAKEMTRYEGSTIISKKDPICNYGWTDPEMIERYATTEQGNATTVRLYGTAPIAGQIWQGQDVDGINRKLMVVETKRLMWAVDHEIKCWFWVLTSKGNQVAIAQVF